MDKIIDTLINLDVDHYLSCHRDVQYTTRGMTEIDRKLWVLNHFVKHGYEENRKYRIKNIHEHGDVPHSHMSPSVSPPLSEHEHEHKHKHNKHTHKDDTTPSIDVLVKKFREEYEDSSTGERDRKIKVTKPLSSPLSILPKTKGKKKRNPGFP